MEYTSDRLIKKSPTASACQQARTLRLAHTAQQIKSLKPKAEAAHRPIRICKNKMSVSSDHQERSCFMVETSKSAYVCTSDFTPGTHVSVVHNEVRIPRALSAKAGKDYLNRLIFFGRSIPFIYFVRGV